MKKTINTFAKATIFAATALVAAPFINAAEITGWGDFKLYLDPGHSQRENRGLWDYSEAEKTLRVAHNIRQMLLEYTDMPEQNIKLCRETDNDYITLEERSDEANAWGADFFYAIHSDASASVNTIVTLFGGWTVNGVNVEKTPNGGKAYGEFLNPNLASVMRVGTRGNRYDRDFYMPTTGTHANQYPYLSVNRRSNMASLLSEGGYHTLAEQQQRNLNDDYKRLEAFAAFQSILQYRGLERPAQNFITGMVTNSENTQPLNGAVITVKAKGDSDFVPRTYTTDTYESLFHKYTKNPDLIHNGFYVFENLPVDTELELTFECQGFDTETRTLTVNKGGEKSADYISFVDVALTSNLPAVVSSVSVSDLGNVDPNYPMVITFSRNMDRESVEKAFSINNGGEVTLSWSNDYTLNVNVSQLLPLWGYVITIDGSIAKNKQTGAFLDGDGDGVAGGNYTLSFTMAEPDVDAPMVVSTYPADQGEALYTKRPPIRVHFNEIINWNDDKNDGWFEVKDSDGKVYEIGNVTHAIVGNASVLHCYLSEDLAADKAILVKLKPVSDLSGNESEDFAFRFLSEYRNCTGTTLIRALDGTGTFWAPSGSGSTSGLTDEGNEIGTINEAPFYGSKTSFAISYSFDEGAANPNWLIRNHDPKGNDTNVSGNTGVITMWVYGDASNNETGIFVRDTASNSLLMSKNPLKLDFLGWNLFTWDLALNEYANFTGNGGEKLAKWYLDAIYIRHYFDFDDPLEPEDPEYPQWVGRIGYNTLQYTTWDNSQRNASIDDVELPSGVESVVATDITLAFNGNILTAVAGNTIETISVYTVDGKLAAALAPASNRAALDLSALSTGLYVVKASTATETATLKIVK